MGMVQVAKDKADDMLQVLQKKARDFLTAEEHLVEAAKALLEEKKWSSQDLRKRLEEGLGRFKANSVLERLRQWDSVVVLGDYKEGIEKRVETTVHSILESLQIASKADIAALSQEIAALRDRLGASNSKNHTNKSKKPRHTM